MKRIFIGLVLLMLSLPLLAEERTYTALDYLRFHQDPNGYWDPQTLDHQCTREPHCETCPSTPDDILAVTAHSLLAHIEQGYDHRTPSRYKPAIIKALTWLLSQEHDTGRFGSTVETQALATNVFYQLFAISADDTYLPLAHRAMRGLLAMRLPDADGKPLVWGDSATGIFDTYLTREAVDAIIAARRANFQAEDSLERVAIWWDQAWKTANPDWEKISKSSLALSSFPASTTATGEATGEDIVNGAWIATSLGMGRDDPALISLVNSLFEADILNPNTLPKHLTTLWVATNTIFYFGGDEWERWNGTSREARFDALPAGTGCQNGSWVPRTPVASPRGQLETTYLVNHFHCVFWIYPRFSFKTQPQLQVPLEEPSSAESDF
jgi:hypothetical protein